MTLRNKSALNIRRQAGGMARKAGPSRTAALQAVPAHEIEIRQHCERENFAAATRVIMQRYGHEVRAFLSQRTPNRTSMEEVFSDFSEDVWKGLPSVRFEGRVRSWVYAVARNALSRHIRAMQRWGRRHVAAELDELQVEARRSADSWLGDHSRLSSVLSELSPEDRRLLEQRLVLSMTWRDIAVEQDGTRRLSSEAELERESARLRKRFQNLIGRLRTPRAPR